MDEGEEGRRKLEEDDQDGYCVVQWARLQHGLCITKGTHVAVHSGIFGSVNIDPVVILARNGDDRRVVGRFSRGKLRVTAERSPSSTIAVQLRVVTSVQRVPRSSIGKGRGAGGQGRRIAVLLGRPRVEMAITLLLLDPLPRAYEPILMTSVPLVGSTLLSLGWSRNTRHATALTPEPSEASQVPSFEEQRRD